MPSLGPSCGNTMGRFFFTSRVNWWDYTAGMVISDDELMLQCQDGSEEAFERLYTRHFTSVWFVVSKIIRDCHVAEDITQDVFTAIHQHPRSYKVGSQFKSWMYRIARNKAIHFLRQRKVDASLDAAPDTAGIESEEAELREVVEQVMDELLPSYRDLLADYYLKGLSTAELSEKLDINVPAVRRRLQTACAAFREKACLKLGL